MKSSAQNSLVHPFLVLLVIAVVLGLFFVYVLNQSEVVAARGYF